MNLKNAIAKAQFLCMLIFYLFFCKSAYGQKDHIIPLSPNTAEITKYGEIPVGNFSGIPNIAIPIYTIKSGDLQLPLNLSYHAGGNKVESIASWVGLSWNLGAVPSISRSVNAFPDENLGGFFSLYSGKTIRQIVNEKEAFPSVYENFLIDSKDGIVDTEPDIFFYTINGASGKFYYSQELQKFITIPKSNIKISYVNGNFIILDEMGVKYSFEDTETTTVSTSSQGVPVTTSWMVTKITNPTNTESILLDYDIELQQSKSLSGEVKYTFLQGELHPSVVRENQPFSASYSLVKAKRLSKITFKNGYLQFLKSDAEREDLMGGYALKAIRLFNSANELLKEFSFAYNYLTGSNSSTGCLDDFYRSNKWMFLTDIEEHGGTVTNNLHHSFVYDNSVYPDCRNSAAQDYWGYYNGANSNASIIPPAFLPGTDILLEGANRYVNPLYSKFGILTRINYPTGGYTIFEYENNQTKNNQLPNVYKKEMAFIAAQIDQTPDENVEIPSQNTFQTTFEINNPRDKFLNNSNPDGGAYISANVAELGVPPGTQGAYLRLRKISGGNPAVDIIFYENFNSRYLPNGTYELSGVFNQNPPNYQNFHCILNWSAMDGISSNYVGGLRIKEIKNYPFLSENPIIKRFKYTDGYNSDKSSGDIFGPSYFNYEDIIKTEAYIENEKLPITEYYWAKYFRQKAYSNQSQVTTGGSYVGYEHVFIQTDEPEQTGVTSYQYRMSIDEYSNVFPYAPVQSMESFRGNIREIVNYKLSNGILKPLDKVSYQYKDILDITPVFGLKTSLDRPDPYHVLGKIPIPAALAYEFFPTWSAESQKLVTTYDMISNEPVISETNYTYNSLGYLESEEFATSKNEALVTKKYYPSYISLIGDAEIARLWFLQNNFLNVVLKEESYLRKPNLTDKLISTKQYNFKKFDGLNLIKLNQLVFDQTNSSFPTVQNFDFYNSAGNVLQLRENNGPNTTYIWSYKSQYPIAEIKNADYATIESILGGTAAVNTIASSTPTDAQVKAWIDQLRNSASLKETQITSYTYKPLVGMTSSTDAKGMTTYYEYDTFQRLKTIKDQNGNILKQTDYHYKN